MTQAPIQWIPFECDGQSFEYSVAHAKGASRPAGWPSHKRSPQRPVPVVMVVVRAPGDDARSGGLVCPEGTIATAAHAIEAARLFWRTLTE